MLIENFMEEVMLVVLEKHVFEDRDLSSSFGSSGNFGLSVLLSTKIWMILH